MAHPGASDKGLFTGRTISEWQDGWKREGVVPVTISTGGLHFPQNIDQRSVFGHGQGNGLPDQVLDGLNLHLRILRD
jgi:hypothetical protein